MINDVQHPTEIVGPFTELMAPLKPTNSHYFDAQESARLSLFCIWFN